MRKQFAAYALVGLIAACNGHGPSTDPSKFQGVIELDERVIGFEVPGRIVRVPVTEGQTISANTELAAVDDQLERLGREARAAEAAAAHAQLALLESGARSEEVRAAQAEVSAAQASVGLLERNLARQRALQTQGASTENRTDELEAQLQQARERLTALQQRERALRSGARAQELDAARAKVAAADAVLKATDERLSKYILRAPMDATVLDIHMDPGEVVAPGTPIVTLADASHPFIDVFVPQARISSFHEGERVRITTDSEKKTYGGRVEHISRRTEFTPRYLFSERERPNLVVRVKIRIDDPNRQLHAGVPAFVTLGGS